jgi:translation initiation factor 2 gamma subunit (eIF-2gamma)
MKNFNRVMSRVDAIIAEQDKSAPVAVGGLLGRTKVAPKQIKSDSPEAQVAKYVAMIRKQREALLK